MTNNRRIITLIVLILTICATPNSTRADACPNGPAARLRPGLAVIISPRINRLNLRALPAVDTGIVALLSPRTPMTVLSGPSCNGGYNWWRVELASGVRGWVAEGTWDDYFVIPAREAEHPADPFEWTCPAWLPAKRCRVP